MKTYLVELLMKQDQMSMAASIESRVPFLDHQLVEFAAALPARSEAVGLDDQAHPARGGEGRAAGVDPRTGRRWAFRCRSAAGLPDGWNARRRATSCSIAARASAASSTRRGRAPAARSRRPGRTDGGDAIWSLLNLELWYRTFIDGDGVQTLPAPGLDRAARRAARRLSA